MNLRKIIVWINLIIIISLSIPQNIFAFSDTEYTREGDEYIIDQSSPLNKENFINIYVLIPAQGVLEGYFDFKFKGLSGENFIEYPFFNNYGYAILKYKNRYENAKVVLKTDNYRIVVFNMALENGSYSFSTNDVTNVSFLTPDLKNPLNDRLDYRDISTVTQHPIKLTGDTYNLYGIIGTKEYMDFYMDDLINYAKGLDPTNKDITQEDGVTQQEQIDELEKKLEELLSKDNVSVEEIGQLIYQIDKAEGSYNKSETDIEPAYKEEVIIDVDNNKTSISGDGVTITNSKDNPINLEEENRKNNNDINFKDLPNKEKITLLIGAILGVILIIYIIKGKTSKRG